MHNGRYWGDIGSQESTKSTPHSHILVNSINRGARGPRRADGLRTHAPLPSHAARIPLHVVPKGSIRQGRAIPAGRVCDLAREVIHSVMRADLCKVRMILISVRERITLTVPCCHLCLYVCAWLPLCCVAPYPLPYPLHSVPLRWLSRAHLHRMCSSHAGGTRSPATTRRVLGSP